jgi:hypothetical protein
MANDRLTLVVPNLSGPECSASTVGGRTIHAVLVAGGKNVEAGRVDVDPPGFEIT